MMNNDIKALKVFLAVALLLILLFPINTSALIRKHTNLDTSELEKVYDIYINQREYLESTALFLKNEELQDTKTAYSISLNELYSVKLKDAGLVVDEGRVITKEEYDSQIKAPYTFLLIGSSSMLEGLGPRLEYELNQIDQMNVYRYGKYSSGLVRLDYYNWNLAAAQYVAKHDPQAVIVQLGGNDAQDIITEGERVKFSSSEWEKRYTQRVHSFMKSLSDVKRVYWVEIPIAKKSSYTNNMQKINSVQESVISNYDNAVYIETWERFAPNGVYQAVLTDETGKKGAVKASDGIHLSYFGAGIMSELIIDQIDKDLK
jgi:hypothetical protein